MKKILAILLLAISGFSVFFVMPVFAVKPADFKSTDLPTRLDAITSAPDQKDLIGVEESGVLFEGVTKTCWYAGTCNFCDILALVVNVSNIILRVFAIIGVIFLIYGAAKIMLSQGNSEQLKKGKDVMKAAIIGGIVVLGAWQIMSTVLFFILKASGPPSLNQAGYNPLTNWFEITDRCRTGITSGDFLAPVSTQKTPPTKNN